MDPELRVLDEQGENLGVMTREAALALATPESGLDLIEVAPTATPPVARVMSYDKYRYLKEKELKKERRAQKTVGLKHIQISAREAPHDMGRKATLTGEFLTEGHQVEIQLRLRGREKGNRDWANQKLTGFLAMIPVEYKVVSPPKTGGRGLAMQIVKK